MRANTTNQITGTHETVAAPAHALGALRGTLVPAGRAMSDYALGGSDDTTLTAAATRSEAFPCFKRGSHDDQVLLKLAEEYRRR